MSETKQLSEVMTRYDNPASYNLFAKPDAVKQDTIVPLSDIYHASIATQNLIETVMTTPKAGIGTKLAAGLARTQDYVSDILPNNWELIKRSAIKDGISDDELEFIELGYRSMQAEREARAIIEQYKGVEDSFWTNIAAGAGIMGFHMALSAIPAAGKYISAAVGGAAAAGDISHEWANKYYEQNYGLKGYSGMEDFILAELYGAINALTEQMGPERMVNAAVVKTGAKRALKQGLIAAGEEAIEEAIQEIAGYFFSSIAGYEDRTFGELIQDAAGSAMYGAILGGVGGYGAYYVNRSKIISYFQAVGYSKEDSKRLAQTVLDDVKKETFTELNTNMSLKQHFGKAYDSLVTKLDSALESSGWTDSDPFVVLSDGRIERKSLVGEGVTFTEASRQEYAKQVAADIAGQILRQAEKAKVSTKAILDLAEIEVVGNMISLKPQKLRTSKQIKAKLDSVNASLKALKAELKIENAKKATLQADPKRVQQLRDAMNDLSTRKGILQQLLITKQSAEKTQDIKAERKKQEIGLDTAQSFKDAKTVAKKQSATEFTKSISKKDATVDAKTAQKRYNNAVVAWLCDGDTRLFDQLMTSNGMTVKAIESIVQYGQQIMAFDAAHPELGLRADMQNALSRMLEMKHKGEFKQFVQQDGTFAENALMYNMVFAQHTGDISAFLQSYIQRAESNTQFTKDDLLFQTLKEIYPTQFDGDTATDKDLVAVFVSQNNQQWGEIVNQDPIESFDIADENARLDAENKPYDGEFIRIIDPVELKQAQFEIVQETNPMQDDYHVGIRSVDDIKTFAETINDEESFVWGDYSRDDAQRDLAKNEITVYSSKPIENGVFVSTSYRQAQEYAGGKGKKVYERTVPLDFVAWINGDEGQFAMTDVVGKKRPTKNSDGQPIAKSEPALRNFWNWFGDSKVVDKDGRPLVVYHGTKAQFDIFETTTIGKASGNAGFYGTGFYFTDKQDEAQIYAETAYVEDVPLSTFSGMTYEQAQELMKKNAVVMPLYLKLENPFMWDNIKTKAEADRIAKQTGVSLSWNKTYKEINRFTNDSKSRLFSEKLKELGYDGVIKGIEFVAFEPNQIKSTQNRGTFSPDTGNIYYQRRQANGIYDPELNVIVLGRNFNTTTLPHELSHFWLNNTFQLFKQAQKGYPVAQEWLDETQRLFDILGIDVNQDTLTYEQQENWASMNEAIITGLADVPDGATLPITGYLNWIPEKYKSLMNIGYRDKNNRVVHPILDKAAMDFFNVWYGNITLPALPTSPAREQASNPVSESGETVPSTPQVIKERTEQINKAIKDQTDADKALYESAVDELPTETRAGINAEYTKYDDVSGLVAEKLPEDKGWFKQGKRHQREEMIKKAREYVKKNAEHAREVALMGKPALNDTGIDLETLILAVMEFDKVDSKSDLGFRYMHNIAMTRSEAGTTLGLHAQDGSYQTYLDGYRRLTAAMTESAAYKYAGRGADSITKFNNDVEALCAKYADAVDNGSMSREQALKALVAEASVKFAGEEDTTILNQLDLTQSGKTREAFVEYAKRLVRRDIAKAEPDTKMQGKLLALAPQAEKASQDVNSKNPATASAAAKKMREWSKLVHSADPRQTMLSGAINSYASRAMLSGISTHVTNILSNTAEQAMLRPAIAAHYGKNIVPQADIDAEKARIKAVYDSTFMDLTTMITPTDPTLVHGEKYKPLDPDAKGWQKVYDAPMRALAAEDNWFRIPTYLDIAARMASRDANGDVNKAKERFKQYTSTQPKKINGKENKLYAKRAEIVTMSAFATFTQNGKLAGALNKMRDGLNSLSIGGYELQLGTLIAPFIKTPANIIASGLRSPFGAGVALIKKLAGKEISFQDAADTAHFIGLAMLALLAGAFCDYEPPYKGGKYDPNKPYDSIGIGGYWLKLNSLGVLEAPMRVFMSVLHGGQGEILETVGSVPLIGELVDNRLNYATQNPTGWAAGTVYNQANKLIPTLIKQVAKPIIKSTGAETDIESIDLGFKTGIGRKIERTYGLDGIDPTINDWLGIVFNRIKITD